MGGFILFFYIFFALATQIYKDYKLQQHIEDFQGRIDELAQFARQKPEDVAYFSSPQYKDRYAKENLNLLNAGEKVIVIPSEDQVVIRGGADTGGSLPQEVLDLPNPNQWWEYFFGQTLSVPVQQAPAATPEPPVDQSKS